MNVLEERERIAKFLEDVGQFSSLSMQTMGRVAEMVRESKMDSNALREIVRMGQVMAREEVGRN